MDGEIFSRAPAGCQKTSVGLSNPEGHPRLQLNYSCDKIIALSPIRQLVEQGTNLTLNSLSVSPYPTSSTVRVVPPPRGLAGHRRALSCGYLGTALGPNRKRRGLRSVDALNRPQRSRSPWT
eukprot:4791042-Amphidinium_carterae.1